MTQRIIKMVDVEVTVSLAMDGGMTWGDIRRWVDEAIEAKLDAERELRALGMNRHEVDPNGPYTTAAYLAPRMSRRHG